LEFKQREGEEDTERDRWDVICWYWGENMTG
jgi:hypothetical protein